MPAPSGVRWFGWTDEAFRKARDEDKVIVLDLRAPWSEGCRVMDAETYGDPDVAELLNRDYVPMRVDSERRPDLNDRYNLGGWPTTAFLTPTGEILGGATYLDRAQMRQFLVQLKTGYETNRARIAEEIARRDEKIAQVLARPPAGLAKLDMEVFRKTVRGILASFDSVHAGFGKAPKFPLPGSLRIVLQALHETQGPDFQEIFLRTLDAIGDRGLFDGAAGGFFHYALTESWASARTEKLGEDNAELVRLYLDASLVCGSDKYAARALQTVEWAEAVLWDDARGVFLGSQAADQDYYSAPDRASRPAPAVDRTVYTTTASALASAFLRAAQVLGERRWADRALRALDFLLRECATPEGVAHAWDGRPELFVLLRDPVALAGACLDAWDHTGEPRWREKAEELADAWPAKFWWEAEKGFADRAVDAIDRGELARLKKPIQENAQAALVYARLWRTGGREEQRRRAEQLLFAFPDFLDGYGHQTAEYALAADWLVRPPETVGPGDLRRYVPRRTVAR